MKPDRDLTNICPSFFGMLRKVFFYKMLRKKNITLNGRKATGNEKLEAGDTIKLFLSDETFDKFSEQKQGWPGQ